MPHLTYEPIPLPWVASATNKRQDAEVKEEGFRLTATVHQNMLSKGPPLRGVVWAASAKGQALQYEAEGDDPDALKQECERVAGLLVAALGLEVPADGG